MCSSARYAASRPGSTRWNDETPHRISRRIATAFERSTASMSIFRYIAFAVAAASAAAMFYIRLYQSRLVGRLICPFFGHECEGVADAPFARPFGIPDGYICAVLYVVILALLVTPSTRLIWLALLALA